MTRTVAALCAAILLAASGCADAPAPAPAEPTAAPAVPASPAPDPAARIMASDPAQIADDLVVDEQTLRDPSAREEVLVAAARRQQEAYRAIGRNPDWDAVIGPLIPAQLTDIYSRNVEARRNLSAMTPVTDTLPAWRVVAPAPADELLGYYREAEAATGVDWTYLAAINLIETRLGRVDGTSDAGARGPMQFLDATFAEYGAGGDILAPRDSIMAAARMLSANGFAENRDGAVFQYNHDDRYVRAVADYAAVLTADPSAFTGYYRWDVYVNTTAGDIPLPVGYAEPAPIPVADYLARQPDTAPRATPVVISPESEQTLERLLTVSRDTASADPSARAAAISAGFLGIPYGANTLVGSQTQPEELVVELGRVDCFTYADYVEALKRSDNRDRFLDALKEVRYKDGAVGFPTRRHFFTDWATATATTPAIATDITSTLSPAAVAVAKNLNQQDSGGVYLPGLPTVPRTVSYIPGGLVDDAVIGGLRTGDYIGAYAPDGGLDVTHVGVYVADPGGPIFRNASSLNRYSSVVDQPLSDYLQTVPGIVVLRPVR